MRSRSRPNHRLKRVQNDVDGVVRRHLPLQSRIDSVALQLNWIVPWRCGESYARRDSSEMSTLITEECINCGACEPECPNTAIYEGGAQWEQDGATSPAIKEDIYYIVPDKCTECVGFFDQEQCAAVCPVDCCIPDPAIPETEEVLIERAKVLHPEQTFGADYPSRFRK